MSIRIGISGFGRIGRNVLRIGCSQPEFQFAGISDVAELESLAYLLKHSTIEGTFAEEVRVDGRHLVSGPQRVRYIQESTPGVIPWDVLGVDLVLECTGKFRTRATLEQHLVAGARKVLLSTPALDEIDRTIINGVNDRELRPDDRIVSNGSSSSHALALMVKILHDAVGVDRALMTTVHAYTGDQQLSDTARPGLRWSRSAAQNIIPNATWAPGAVERMIPELAGKIDGLALNVPVPAGSNIDLTARLKKKLSVAEVNSIFREAAEGPYRGLVDYTEEPIVSSDVIGNYCSAVIDASATMAIGEGLVKVLGWFDNGWAYAARMLELARWMMGDVPGESGVSR
ncbi:MAG: type I glyceraldehyde-3-phosphate dehydrogenase [Deltaproteobacteria bacterium]|nr:type I glyceraldehyde-3-phosphate dehydrogenase [Deltaproteobacteria bacterium]